MEGEIHQCMTWTGRPMRKAFFTKRFFIVLVWTGVLAMTLSVIANVLNFSPVLFWAILLVTFLPFEVCGILYVETGKWNPKKAIEALPRIEDKNKDA